MPHSEISEMTPGRTWNSSLEAARELPDVPDALGMMKTKFMRIFFRSEKYIFFSQNNFRSHFSHSTASARKGFSRFGEIWWFWVDFGEISLSGTFIGKIEPPDGSLRHARSRTGHQNIFLNVYEQHL